MIKPSLDPRLSSEKTAENEAWPFVKTEEAAKKRRKIGRDDVISSAKKWRCGNRIGTLKRKGFGAKSQGTNQSLCEWTLERKRVSWRNVKGNRRRTWRRNRKSYNSTTMLMLCVLAALYWWISFNFNKASIDEPSQQVLATDKLRCVGLWVRS